MMRPISDSMPGGTDALVAEYVCGLLKPDEHVQVHVLLSRDDRALALALAWEETMLALVDALPRVPPDPAVRERLQRTLGIGPPPPPPQLLRQRSRDAAAPELPPVPAALPASPEARPEPASALPRAAAASSARDPVDNTMATPAPSSKTQDAAAPRSQPPRQAKADGKPREDDGRYRSLIRKLWLWRLIGLCAASAAIVGFMMPGEPPPPPVQIVKVAPTRAAILQAPGATSTPGWTATLDPQGNLMMRPLVHTEVPTGQQTLLWTRSEKIPEPRLLGRIDPNRPVQVPAARLGALADDQLLEITLESEGDASQGTPNGPILFIGQMTVFGSEAAAAPATGQAASAAAGAVTQASRP